MSILKTLQEGNMHNNCLMGLKVWWNWGSRKKKSKSKQVGRFFENRLPTWRLPMAILSQILRFWKKKIKKPLKVPSLARSVPKPLKVPSLARSVPKPLKMPSLARSVAKPLKVPSLARSVPKPLLIELREAGGHQPGTYEPLLIFAADLLLSWLWKWSEVKWVSEVSEWVKWVSEVSDHFLGLVFLWNFYML